MKVVLAIAVLACLAVGAFGTASFQGALSVDGLTLTSSSLNTATNWGISGVMNDASFQGDGNGGDLHVEVNATFTGVLKPGVYPSAEVTFSPASYTARGGGCNVAATQSLFPVVNGNVVTYSGDLPLIFTATGSVTATVNLYFPPGTLLATRAFTFNVVNPVYVPPTAGLTPTVSSWSLLASAPNVNSVGANVTIAGAAVGTYTVAAYFLANSGNQGVAWVTACAIVIGSGTTGSCTVDDFSTLTPYIGSWCGDVFSGFPAAAVDYTANVALTLRSVTVGTNSFAPGPQVSYNGNNAAFAGGTSLTVVSGDTDTVAPTCSSAAFTPPLAINTADADITNVITLVCADTGGSNLQYTGVFVRAEASGLVYEFAAGPGATLLTPVLDVPLHYSGTVNVVGVWAMDGDGNAVVYGRCVNGSPQTICGSSGASSDSSAVVASISLVIALILAVLAL
jgi:hypothetical protein